MITIYGNSRCLYCNKAKALVTQYSLDHQWMDTDDQHVLNELKKALPDVKTIPQIWWHKKHIGGYEDLVTEIQNTFGNYGQDRL